MADSRKFSVSLEIEWPGYALDVAILEQYIKSRIEHGTGDVAKVVYINTTEVDDFEHGMGDQWGRR